MKAKKPLKFGSDACAAIHESARALREIGAINKKAMREFDRCCIEAAKSPTDGTNRNCAKQARERRMICE